MAHQWISPRVVVETEHYGSNQSAVVGRDGVVLIDAPHLPTDALAWGYFAKSLGNVKYLVNSDHHPDHTIGNRFLPGEIIANAETRNRLETEPPTMEYLRDLLARLDPEGKDLLLDYSVRLPTILVENSLSLSLGDLTLEFRALKGHTRNNLLTYFADDRIIFTGDVVCEAGLPSFQDSHLNDWFDALDTVEGFDFDQLVPGHGTVTNRDGVQRFREMGRGVIALVGERMDKGQEPEQIRKEVRFADNIHVATDTSAGYPDDLIESFQVRSVSGIIEDLQNFPELRHR
jgi:cyclase